MTFSKCIIHLDNFHPDSSEKTINDLSLFCIFGVDDQYQYFRIARAVLWWPPLSEEVGRRPINETVSYTGKNQSAQDQQKQSLHFVAGLLRASVSLLFPHWLHLND